MDNEIEILLVEDSSSDAELTIDALKMNDCSSLYNLPLDREILYKLWLLFY